MYGDAAYSPMQRWQKETQEMEHWHCVRRKQVLNAAVELQMKGHSEEPDTGSTQTDCTHVHIEEPSTLRCGGG
jgi:hypothetical protein